MPFFNYNSAPPILRGVCIFFDIGVRPPPPLNKTKKKNFIYTPIMFGEAPHPPLDCFGTFPKILSV